MSGIGFIPDVLNRTILDEGGGVADEEGFACPRRLGREEGIIAGVSSGGVVHAALVIPARPEACENTVVVRLPDTGERILTTPRLGAG